MFPLDEDLQEYQGCRSEGLAMLCFVKFHFCIHPMGHCTRMPLHITATAAIQKFPIELYCAPSLFTIKNIYPIIEHFP